MPSEHNAPARLGTYKDLASEVGVSERTIRRLVRNGHIPAFRLSGGRRILLDLDKARATMLVPVTPQRGDK